MGHRVSGVELDGAPERVRRIPDEEPPLVKRNEQRLIAVGNCMSRDPGDTNRLDLGSFVRGLLEDPVEEVLRHRLVAHFERRQNGGNHVGRIRVEGKDGLGHPDGDGPAAADPGEDVLGEAESDLLLGHVVELAQRRIEIRHLVDDVVLRHRLGEGLNQPIHLVEVGELEEVHRDHQVGVGRYRLGGGERAAGERPPCKGSADAGDDEEPDHQAGHRLPPFGPFGDRRGRDRVALEIERSNGRLVTFVRHGFPLRMRRKRNDNRREHARE